MTTLNIIEELLNIEIGDQVLRNGRVYNDKNRYYWYRNEYYIVNIGDDKWTIMSSNDTTRDMLDDYIWRCLDGYATTDEGKRNAKTLVKLHRILLVCPDNMQVDHINIKKFDNRIHNLRIATQQEQNRNKNIIITNTSGITGVSKTNRKNDNNDWVAFINDNQGNKLRKSFACKKYGDNEANQMAINQRLIWKQQYNYLGE